MEQERSLPWKSALFPAPFIPSHATSGKATSEFTLLRNGYNQRDSEVFVRGTEGP